MAFLVSLGLSDIIISALQKIPEASEFRFFWTAVPRALALLIAIVVMAWFPAWWTMGGKEEQKIWFTRLDILVPLLLAILILFLLFGSPVFALAVGV